MHRVCLDMPYTMVTWTYGGDGSQLFYFQQRGVGMEDAVAMIISGFCAEVPHPPHPAILLVPPSLLFTTLWPSQSWC